MSPTRSSLSPPSRNSGKAGWKRSCHAETPLPIEGLSMSVRVEENIWITMSDGCRLGARLWLPEAALADPVPAVLEYIPYRKRDGTRGRDEPMHGYFAQNGYAAI